MAKAHEAPSWQGDTLSLSLIHVWFCCTSLNAFPLNQQISQPLAAFDLLLLAPRAASNALLLLSACSATPSLLPSSTLLPHVVILPCFIATSPQLVSQQLFQEFSCCLLTPYLSPFPVIALPTFPSSYPPCHNPCPSICCIAGLPCRLSDKRESLRSVKTKARLRINSLFYLVAVAYYASNLLPLTTFGQYG